VARDAQADDDRALVSRCQSGDEAAFEQLVRKYQQVVFNLIYHNLGYRGDVEDVAQKVFSKVYFSLSKFDNKRPFFPWLYRIAVNQCYDELRRARRRRLITFSELSLDDSDAIEKLVSQPETAAANPPEDKEMHALLLRLLDQLPDPQRTALVMRDLEDVPYEKLAEVLNCTEQAARLKVFRARARLRDLMEKALRRQKRAQGRR
jgi:RNA polymerase sigma-70 factor (ECF subfamily)